MILIAFLVGISLSLRAADSKCPLSLKIESKPAGSISQDRKYGVSDILFLSPTEILVANHPIEQSQAAPLEIYELSDKGWSYSEKKSAYLPKSYHARQLLLEDMDGDKIPEVIIADHGPDIPPYPGSHPVILKKSHGVWKADHTTGSLGTDFTFNVAVLPISANEKALYRANVSGKTPILHTFDKKKKKWKDTSHLIPSELGPHKLCYMTALVHDFNMDGKVDMFLGGCDQDNESSKQKHDLFLSQAKGKWELLPQDILPPRRMDSKWGTVFVKTFDVNSDSKKDLLLATHDFGFRNWRTLYYENESTPEQMKFKEVILPLKQESNTEGYVHSLQDFKIGGSKLGILAEVRSVLRDKSKKHPRMHTRLVIEHNQQFVDVSSCLPKELKETSYIPRIYPSDPSKILLVPYKGQIFTLKIDLK